MQFRWTVPCVCRSWVRRRWRVTVKVVLLWSKNSSTAIYPSYSEMCIKHGVVVDFDVNVQLAHSVETGHQNPILSKTMTPTTETVSFKFFLTTSCIWCTLFVIKSDLGLPGAISSPSQSWTNISRWHGSIEDCPPLWFALADSGHALISAYFWLCFVRGRTNMKTTRYAQPTEVQNRKL